MKKAEKKNKECSGQYDVFDEFPDMETVLDSAKVEEFLRTNAKHPYVKDFLFKEYVNWDKYLDSLTESDREILLMLDNYKDYVLKEEVVNFLKPDAPKIFKEAVLEYIEENSKEV